MMKINWYSEQEKFDRLKKQINAQRKIENLRPVTNDQLITEIITRLFCQPKIYLFGQFIETKTIK